ERLQTRELPGDSQGPGSRTQGRQRGARGRVTGTAPDGGGVGRVVSACEGTWIRIPEAARLVGMSRQGMRKRLLRLNQIAGGRLLRRDSATGRGGNFEVCVEVLRELRSYDPKERERELG